MILIHSRSVNGIMVILLQFSFQALPLGLLHMGQ